MKSAQDALAASYAELRKLQELRDNLTHIIIHDLPPRGKDALMATIRATHRAFRGDARSQNG